MKNISLIATASAAIIKVKKIKNLLEQKGYKVKVIPTPSALKYYSKIQEICTVEINQYLEKNTSHIFLAKNSDLIVVAPASANTIAKFVNGAADNMALAIMLAAKSKILFAPAMNNKMFEATIDRNHIDWLEKNGHFIIGPNFGWLKEGYQAMGRMAEPIEIVNAIENILKPSKIKISVSYGASKTMLDSVRFISNKSSGKFGKAIIKELRLCGFEVLAIDASKHSNKEILSLAKKTSVYIGCGALADFSFQAQKHKIKKSKEIILKGVQDIDVLTQLSKTDTKIIGFKADENKKYAIEKLDKLNLEAIFWNKPDTMGSDKVSGLLITKNKQEIKFDNDFKYIVAKHIAMFIKKLVNTI